MRLFFVCYVHCFTCKPVLLMRSPGSIGTRLFSATNVCTSEDFCPAQGVLLYLGDCLTGAETLLCHHPASPETCKELSWLSKKVEKQQTWTDPNWILLGGSGWYWEREKKFETLVVLESFMNWPKPCVFMPDIGELSLQQSLDTCWVFCFLSNSAALRCFSTLKFLSSNADILKFIFN